MPVAAYLCFHTIACMIPEEQIERFFKKQCTAEEAHQVANWLTSNVELASKYLNEAEWHNSSPDKSLPEETYKEVWQQINKSIRKKNAIVLLKRCAVAACIIGCMVVGFYHFNINKSAAALTEYHKTEVPTIALSDTEYNRTNKVRRIQLEDGSVVSLLPKSVVWFDTPFTKMSRDVYLKGEARFEVAKDKQKPFTVYAGTFATTALGTEFIIKQQPDNFKVQLLHGKVVIKATDSAIRNWKNVYLLPGQQMIYNEEDAVAKVSFTANQMITSNTLAVTKKTQSETADSLIFDGSTMPAVFEKLRNYYNVNIQFTASDLNDLSFTGVIAKRDSVQNILKVIAQMNGLAVEEKDSGFIISKINTNDTHP